MPIGSPQPFRGGQGIVDWLIVILTIILFGVATYFIFIKVY